MWTRREVLTLAGLVPVAAANAAAAAAQGAKRSKDQTVVLEISGMTWEGCTTAVRAALLAVKGVKRARVTLEPPEATVTYDPSLVKIEDLIQAVSKAEPPGDQSYSAKVKKPPKDS